jgi:arsenite methyltransferase
MDGTTRDDLRDRVRRAYSDVAADPDAPHPFPVGRRLAEATGYPESWLSEVPPGTLEAFAGISCLPCFAEVSPESRVLDLGCGAGLDSLLLARQARSVVGLDFSCRMLEQARAAAEVASVTNAEFLQGDAEVMPLETASVDVAIVNGIFNLNPAREAIFRDLARVVRPGGTVYAAELILSGPSSDVSGAPEADWFA